MERLKRTELRLGNLVLNNEGKYCSVIHMEVDPMGDEYMFSPCFGIPITPEILEKAGFVPIESGCDIYTLSIGRITFNIQPSTTSVCFQFDVGMGFSDTMQMPASLHQLQNLIFALTGKELEINL